MKSKFKQQSKIAAVFANGSGFKFNLDFNEILIRRHERKMIGGKCQT